MDAIVIESVSKVFRDRAALAWLRRNRRSETRALAEISLRIPIGTVQVLLGPNGSGKTTLLKLISTMLLPDSGSLIINGCDTRRHGQAVRKMVGFAVASERSFFPRLSARENLDFFATLDDVPRRVRSSRIRELLQTTSLEDHADRLLMTFSSGMYQRLGIARALLKSPSVVLLDEPSRSLDPGSGAQLSRLIRELSYRGATVIIATHSFQEAVAVGDDVAILCRGVLTGHCRMENVSTADRLRAFYFDRIGDNNEQPDLVHDAPGHECAFAR
jgi:ABC-2 type transport system ATP-binding protein